MQSEHVDDDCDATEMPTVSYNVAASTDVTETAGVLTVYITLQSVFSH